MNKVSKLLSCCLNTCYAKVGKVKWKNFDFVSVENQGLKNVKLSNCSCMASHNSVVSDIQIGGKASLHTLMKVLNMNFRMIELDVFKDYDTNTPLVSHGNLEYNLQVTSNVKVKECLKLIEANAFKCTDLPLFLAIEMNIDANEHTTLENLQSMLELYLGQRILRPDEKWLGDYTIEELKGKVVVLSMSRRQELLDIVYLHTADKNFMNVSENYKFSGKTTKLTRVYPANIINSTNYDAVSFIEKGCHFVSVNATWKDVYLKNYLNYFFNNCGIIKLN